MKQKQKKERLEIFASTVDLKPEIIMLLVDQGIIPNN